MTYLVMFTPKFELHAVVWELALAHPINPSHSLQEGGCFAMQGLVQPDAAQVVYKGY